MSFLAALGFSTWKITSKLLTNVPTSSLHANFHSLMKITGNSAFPHNYVGATNRLIPFCPLLVGVCGFKMKVRLKRRCKDCYFVIRQERLYVMCKTHPRHKQMQIKKPEKKTWILTHATQGKIRPW